MSSHYFFRPPPCRCPPMMMLPNPMAVYPPLEEDPVSLSAVYDLLEEQQIFFRRLLQQQERSHRAFLQLLMDSSAQRTDNLLRELQDLRGGLEGVRKQALQTSKRVEGLVEELETVRGVLEGLKSKPAGGRAEPTQPRGPGGLGPNGNKNKKPEPKAAKLVADLTDISFKDIKWKKRRALPALW
ncbi:unnamed protein product [Menidia menidia]|uniref:(Atlantic silverside) hypothetical protein n=1 Tax=Menidia menidia TaxID=238744 RepID=A0A8S4ABY3_9TELE|nr:unnamed protein product [Menidia menidia]